MEEVFGRDYSEMLALLGYQDLEATVAELPARDTHLFLDLTGRDPDEAATKLAYEKGYFLLRLIEETVGREAWDAFLRDYFDRHAFQSMTTAEFVDELREKLLSKHEGSEDQIGVEQWVNAPGIPVNVPQVHSDAFTKVEAQVKAFEGGAHASQLATQNWSTHEWIHFLRHLPKSLNYGHLVDLDEAFHFTDSGNSEILHEWLMNASTSTSPRIPRWSASFSSRAAASSSSRCIRSSRKRRKGSIARAGFTRRRGRCITPSRIGRSIRFWGAELKYGAQSSHHQRRPTWRMQKPNRCRRTRTSH
jgi:hypothetical protein